MRTWIGVRAVAIAGAFALTAAAGVAMAEDAPATSSAPEQTATPAQPATPAAPAATQTKDPLDEVVCKKDETTGTRLGAKKICKTRREWMQAQSNAQTFLKDGDKAAGAMNPTGGSGN